MDLGIRGKVAMVMASSSGLGKAVAMGLAREGADVSICARHEARLVATANEIREASGSMVLSVPTDVSQRDELQLWVDDTVSELGPPLIVVTNTGSPPQGNLPNTSETDWRESIDSILMSVVHVADMTLPFMRQAGWGRLITITSAQVKMPQNGMMLSSSIRNAVIGLTRSLANEVASEGITVNSVLPGKVRTERFGPALRAMAQRDGTSIEEVEARITQEVPAGRFGQPKEFADPVVFLASERTSWITGVSLRVDGGFCRALD